METCNILLVKDGPQDPFDAIGQRLALDPNVTLASEAPVSVEQAVVMIWEQPEIAVILIIGQESAIPAIASAIRAARSDVHMLAVSIETGITNLSMRNLSFDQLRRIIHMLARPAAPANEGRVLRFHLRTEPNDAEQAEEAAPAAYHPAPLAVEVDGRIAGLIDQSLDWVEAATRVLLDVWSPRKDEAPGFVPGLELMERLLEGFVSLFGEAPERPEKLFRKLVASLRAPENAQAPLAILFRKIDDDQQALKFLLLAGASDFDIRFHRLFGTLHDDLSRRYPSVGLACAIIAAGIRKTTPASIRGAFALNDPLRRLGIVPRAGPATLAGDMPLRLPPALADWLVTGDSDALLGAEIRRLYRPAPEDAAALLSADRKRRIRAAVRHALIGRDLVSAIFLTGSSPGWTVVEAAAIADKPLVLAPPASPFAPEMLAETLAELASAARLAGWTLIFDLGGKSPESDALWSALNATWPQFAQPPYLIATNATERLAGMAESHIVSADLPVVTRHDRQEVIANALSSHNVEDDALAEHIADAFPIALDRIPQAIALAQTLAAANGRPSRPEADDWLGGFRRMAGARLPSLARRVEPAPRVAGAPPAIEAVVLPAIQRGQLRELVSHVRHTREVLEDWGFADLTDGRGVAALFSGESGTGKTTAAHAVATELGADLYVIELAQVVSKYIGETEKNLDLIFGDAQDAGAVLLFDEADALFGKRSSITDAHDRYANIEVAYLLQRIQRFTGLAILTSNHAESIDAAFTRRLRFKVEFPRPSAGDRLLIWEQSIPVPLRARPLALRPLALALDVTGGVIRQMALHAAMLAAEADRLILMEDVLAGARSQLVRLGRFADLARVDAVEAACGREAA
ncbi:ATP-binding protein [Sphingobium yanoikuyae]|uniref:ATP-binding protein n=1 Tax=Sphingobium yanoikuyae TaxID=13690 RepID=UPI000476269C|nr:ATP-binding protein [Sphingobium yanoikuyae]